MLKLCNLIMLKKQKGGDYNVDDFENLLKQTNPFSPILYKGGEEIDNPKYKEYIERNLEQYAEVLESYEPGKKNNPYGRAIDPKDVALSLAISKAEQFITDSTADTLANKYGHQDDTILSWAIPEGKTRNGNPAYDGVTPAPFTATVIGTSTTQSKVTNYQTRLKESSANLISLQERKKNLTADGGNEAALKKVNADIEIENRKIERVKKQKAKITEHTFRSARLKGMFPNIESFSDLISINYNAYRDAVNEEQSENDSVEGQISDSLRTSLDIFGIFGSLSGVQKVTEAYIKLRPDANIDPSGVLDEGQYNEFFADQVTKLLLDEDTLLTRGTSDDFAEIFEDENPLETFQNFTSLDFVTDHSPKNQKDVYAPWNNAKVAVKNILAPTLRNLFDIDGLPLQDVIKSLSEEELLKNMEVDILGNDYDNSILLNVRYSEDALYDGNAGKLEQRANNPDIKFNRTIAISPEDVNYETIKNNLLDGVRPTLDFYMSIPPEERTATHKEAMYQLSNLNGVLSGEKRRFNEDVDLYSKDEGDITPFGVGHNSYEFLTFRYGYENTNRIAVIKHGTEAAVANADGIVDPLTFADKAIAGYHENNWDFQRGKPVPGAEVSYFAITEDEETNPYHIDKTTNDVVFKPWFIPHEETNPDEVFASVMYETTMDGGNANVNAIDEKKLAKNYNYWMSDRKGGQTINDRIGKLVGLGYTESNNYIPLTNFVDSNMIDKDVFEPFLVLPKEGTEAGNIARNKITTLFEDYSLFITGGGRDKYNKVKGADEDSHHNDFIALDILKTPEAMRLVKDPNRYKKYGIIQVLIDYNNHIHIAFDKSMKGELNLVDRG